MSSKDESIDEKCDKPEIKAKFHGHCSDDQICKCHGKQFLEEQKKA